MWKHSLASICIWDGVCLYFLLVYIANKREEQVGMCCRMWSVNFMCPQQLHKKTTLLISKVIFKIIQKENNPSLIPDKRHCLKNKLLRAVGTKWAVLLWQEKLNPTGDSGHTPPWSMPANTGTQHDDKETLEPLCWSRLWNSKTGLAWALAENLALWEIESEEPDELVWKVPWKLHLCGSILSPLIFQIAWWGTTLFFQMRKLKLREVKRLVQG